MQPQAKPRRFNSFLERVTYAMFPLGIMATITYIYILCTTGVLKLLFTIPMDSPGTIKFFAVVIALAFIFTRGATGPYLFLMLVGDEIIRVGRFQPIPQFAVYGFLLIPGFVIFITSLLIAETWWSDLLHGVPGMVEPKPGRTAQENPDAPQVHIAKPVKANIKTNSIQAENLARLERNLKIVQARPVADPRAFDHLIGVEHAIQEFKNALELPVMHPELVDEYQIDPVKGIIMYGPPGTGKTSLAKAVAEYFALPFVYCKASALSGRYVGTTEENVRDLFRRARTQAREQCCRVIVFMDEIDAIAQKRDGRHSNRPSDLILNPLLEELDGFKNSTAVYMIAATNRIDVLDEALLRPGRFDRRIEVGYPSETDRRKLFALYVSRVPRAEGDEIDQSCDKVFAECAQRVGQVSPADIKEICQRAKVRAATREMWEGICGIKGEDLRREVEAWVSGRKKR